MPEFQLVMRAGPTPGKAFPVSGESFTIGREPGNGIVINDPEISRKHSRMWQQGDTYSIEDLGSTNGTFVNGVRLNAPHALRPGEVVALGEQISLVFEAVVSDPNATVMHAAKPVIVAAAPSPAPVSQPISQPIPAYAGQVPAGPEPAAPASKKRSPMLAVVIVLLIVFLCIFCLCLGFFWWIDSDPTGGRWCQIAPFMVSAMGGACP